MNTPLDSFESALLTELRQHVVDHPAPVPDGVTPLLPRRRRRLRLALSAAAVGTAASVVAVLGLGTGGGSPAYAVDRDSHGDVVATIHRLDDAAGLEKALRAQGIDADVSYSADGSAGEFGTGEDAGGPPPTPLPVPGKDGGPGTSVRPQDGSTGPAHVQAGGQPGTGDGPSTSGPGAGKDSCGPIDPPPATLTQDGGDWVLTIPSGSPLMDRHVDIGTDANGALSVTYAGSQPGSFCGVMSLGAPPAEKSQ